MQPEEAIRSALRLFDNQHSRSNPMTLDIPEQQLGALAMLCDENGIRLELN
jgi:hypothetical protein